MKGLPSSKKVNFLDRGDSRISEALLIDNNFNDTNNTSIQNTTVDSIVSVEGFDAPLINCWFIWKYICTHTWLLLNPFRLHVPVYINDFSTTCAYSEPCQTPKMERFADIVNGFQSLTIL